MSRSAMPPWTATVLSLYPDMFPGPLALALAGQGLQDGVWALETVNIRDFATDKHGTVDDTPAGGGPGMVLRADVLGRAVDTVWADSGRPLIYLTPRGVPLTQERVQKMAAEAGPVLICGRFEGIDERVLEARPIEEISLGDFVLAGGEMAAFALIDATVRLLPGIVGDTSSLAQESFETGLLEYPHYTRPRNWEGKEIPEILLSGDHAKVDAWRLRQSEELTQHRRPDLWARYQKKRGSS